jgi:hypothetical protein
METPNRHSISSRVFPPIAVWTVNKILASPVVKERTKRLDARVHAKKLKALKALQKSGRNAVSNPGWLAAGIAAVALGLGLITKSALKS